MSHVLVVEDRDTLRQMMCRALEQAGHTVTAAADAESAITRLKAGDAFDLVLTDLKLPGGSGIDVVATVRDHQPTVPVVVLTAFGTVDHAVEAMKLGAVDFLEKPLELDELLGLVQTHTDGGHETSTLDIPGATPIVAGHPRMRAAIRLLRKVAPTDSTVLLTGESGTGKELFARALHAFSARQDGPFVAINCAAIPESLIENELFGHEKGAFTGAARRQAGRFEVARGGTLFLDEIGELALGVQGKVLRVLEERTFERIGGGKTIRTDVRLIAATNRDLDSMTRAGTFRADLFFRLEVFPIALPPLRERSSDTAQLAQHLVTRISARLGRSAPRLDREAEALLAAQPWPGNVRQLANVLERALILDDAPRLGAPALRPFLEAHAPVDERLAIREALRAVDGDKNAAAARLGISYRTLQRKVRALDLEGYPRYRTE